MIWKSQHREGDTREVSRFAWTPVVLTNGFSLWLEAYREEQVFASGEWRVTYRGWIPGASV